MSIDLDTHKAPRPQPRPRLELPPIVRDYLEHVRGNPEMFGRILPDYLDRLWAQAIDFATRNAVTCPIHREEIDALRTAIEGGVFSEAVSCRVEAALVNELGPVSSVTSAPAKSLRKSARDARCPGAPLKKKKAFPAVAFAEARHDSHHRGSGENFEHREGAFNRTATRRLRDKVCEPRQSARR